ncbi:MAG: DUF1902 domain-containing protein [Rhodobacteraceae bacterium]|nr:DUF1902 domain-containing protein [Paracoccaceae bacterium]
MHTERVPITVRADWDEDARVWVATSGAIDGLAVESATLEGLQDKVAAALRDLIDLNGAGAFDGSLPDIPAHIVAQKTFRVAMPG